ncbi:MAG: ABC transporter substrate binding protein [Culicoidibacterales bacterium]
MRQIGKLAIVIMTSILLLGGCLPAAKNQQLRTIGVLQLVTHPSLDVIYQGFVEELAKNDYIDGETIKIVYQNAQNDQANLKSMSEKLVKESELIFSIATPASQAVAAQTKTKPLIIGGISDPIGAGLVTSLEHPGGNITGVKHETPVEKQIQLLSQITPKMKTIGFIYNAAETNSTSQIKRAELEAQKLGLKVEKTAVSSTNEVQQAILSLANKVDGIYIPNDNTLAASMETVKNVVEATKTPLVAAAIADTKIAGVATIGIDDKQMGVEAAKQAIEILEGRKQPGEIPIAIVDETALIINEEMAIKQGINTATLKELQ